MKTWHRPLMLFAAANAVLTLFCLVALMVDDRVLVGAPIWLKPLKFAVSFVLYSIAWAWLLSLHPRRPRWLHHLGTFLVVAGGIAGTLWSLRSAEVKVLVAA